MLSHSPHCKCKVQVNRFGCTLHAILLNQLSNYCTTLFLALTISPFGTAAGNDSACLAKYALVFSIKVLNIESKNLSRQPDTDLKHLMPFD